MDDYVNRQRQGYDVDAVLHGPITALTTTATGSAVLVGENVELDIVSRVGGAVSGTSPTLNVTVQCASDAAFTTPVPLGAIQEQSAAGVARGMFRTSEKYVRAVLTVAGTNPSFGDTEVFIAS